MWKVGGTKIEHTLPHLDWYDYKSTCGANKFSFISILNNCFFHDEYIPSSKIKPHLQITLEFAFLLFMSGASVNILGHVIIYFPLWSNPAAKHIVSLLFPFPGSFKE